MDQSDLKGHTVLITAGPTREPIDPVRFISNRSSGRMGFALAQAAAERGARVVLIAGPVNLATPAVCERVDVETADDMYEATMARFGEASIAIMAAAVADYRPVSPAGQKLKKRSGAPRIVLVENRDILKEAGRRKRGQLLIGFAAETQDLRRNAQEKLLKKNCDAIVANLVGPAANGTGFDSVENQGWMISADGEIIELPRSSKQQMAHSILDRVVALGRARTSSASLPATHPPPKPRSNQQTSCPRW